MTQREKEVQKERDILDEIFEDLDTKHKKLISGILDEAAFLKVENNNLRKVMNKTGMVKIHPKNPGVQKTTEAAKQYRQNVNAYAVLIKTMNSVLKNFTELDDDPFDEWLRSKQEEKRNKGH